MRTQISDVTGALDWLWQKSMELGEAAGCHQKPERSFFIAGRQMPVCARCLGLFLGSLAALPAAARRAPSVAQLAYLLPLAADGLSQRLGLRRSNNTLRLATGLLGGFGYTSALLAAVALVVKKTSRPKP